MTKKSFKKNLFCIVMVFLFCLLFNPFLNPAFSEDYLGQGNDQLVAALDAAFIRVVDSGKYRELMDNDPVAGPLMVTVADCYPNVAEANFPENPTGLLAHILDTGEITVGTYNTLGNTGSFDLFTDINQKILRAIADELGNGYGLATPIEVVETSIFPPSSSTMYERLNNGVFDISNLNAALGGTVTLDDVSVRRRNIARFTCTVLTTAWYLHVKDTSPYQSINDMLADTSATICSGMLSARISKAYFKNQTVVDQYFDDIEVCSANVDNGTYSAYLSLDPVPVLPGLRSIDLNIVSGVPLWVAGDKDRDKDRITDNIDNCPDKYNTEQTDADGDGLGDACDPDAVAGNVSGAVRAGVLMSLYQPTCAGNILLDTETTNSEGRYSFGFLGTGIYAIAPDDADYTFTPELDYLKIPQETVQPYDFNAIVN